MKLVILILFLLFYLIDYDSTFFFTPGFPQIFQVQTDFFPISSHINPCFMLLFFISDHQEPVPDKIFVFFSVQMTEHQIWNRKLFPYGSGNLFHIFYSRLKYIFPIPRCTTQAFSLPELSAVYTAS